MLGKAYPSGTAIVETTVGRRREPPSRTNSSFPSARTTISILVERYVPGPSGNLSFQSTTGEVQPSDSRVLISRRTPQEPPGWTTSPFPPTSAKPVGCRLSIPTKTLPFRLHLSDAVSLDLPSDAGASSPARHPYLF